MKIKVLSILLLSALPATVWATGPFAFFDLSYAKGDLSPGVLSDDSDTGFSFGGGYMFTDLIGAEGGYVSYGDMTSGAARISGNGWLGGMRFELPLSDGLGAFGRVGMHWWDAEVTGEPTETGNNTYFGVGGSFGLSDSAAAYAAWNRYLIDYPGTDVTYDHWGVGVEFRF